MRPHLLHGLSADGAVPWLPLHLQPAAALPVHQSALPRGVPSDQEVGEDRTMGDGWGYVGGGRLQRHERRVAGASDVVRHPLLPPGVRHATEDVLAAGRVRLSVVPTGDTRRLRRPLLLYVQALLAGQKPVPEQFVPLARPGRHGSACAGGESSGGVQQHGHSGAPAHRLEPVLAEGGVSGGDLPLRCRRRRGRGQRRYDGDVQAGRGAIPRTARGPHRYGRAVLRRDRRGGPGIAGVGW